MKIKESTNQIRATGEPSRRDRIVRDQEYRKKKAQKRKRGQRHG